MTVAGTGRPLKGYRLADGSKCPSVTQITSRFKESGGLVHWAWSLGIDGIDYRAARDSAADAGSICHGWIEDWIHGRRDVQFIGADVPAEIDEQALQGFAAFKDWAESAQLEVIETEVALVSETYKFGGTFDALGLVAGKPKLLDWKSSNSAYLEYVVQLAAYRQLIRERQDAIADEIGHAEKPPDSALLLRVGKRFADFHLHSYTPQILDMGWRYFLLLREAFELAKDLKSVAS